MSGLPPTPISGRKQSLRPHLKTPRGFPPVEEEPEKATDNRASSENEGRTQYNLAEEGDVIEGPSDSRRIGRGKQPEHGSPEITESIQDTPSPSVLIDMPTPATNGTITMTAADLLAFCQQMMNARSATQTSEHASIDVKKKIQEYQREVQASMNTKTVITFNGTNYRVSRQKLVILQVKDNDYLAFQRRFRYLSPRYKKLASSSDDFYHDLFLNDLQEHQKAFVNTRLDDFYATGQDSICNIDMNDLMKQLTNRTSKTKDERLKPQRVTTTSTASTTSTWNASSSKCDWRELNKDKIITTEENTGRKRRGKKDKEKDDKKEESDLLASQPAAANAAIALLAAVDLTSKQGLCSLIFTCASFKMTGEKQSLIQRNAYDGNLKANTVNDDQSYVKEIENLSVYFHGESYKYEHANAMAAINNNDSVNDQSTVQPEEAFTIKTLAEWHADVGHIHAGAIIALVKNPLFGIRIKGPKTSFFCDICVKAGMRKYSQTLMPRALRAMERVHVDLAGGGRTLSR
ncbi:hypothetical protein AJ78_04475 [Emergomyces pasteurianus Ep9510]|uniref:GAG-pre-integrase domain-containing protein n=1 Tax=Emergomyces pasteurianus Ep9510 TaxID=1447872 RepID=A0A1J9QJ68_9EURO|nr:hypothetical protein AJ78_04475 [Emergomyces pasteurianus Ep9510]